MEVLAAGIKYRQCPVASHLTCRCGCSPLCVEYGGLLFFDMYLSNLTAHFGTNAVMVPSERGETLLLNKTETVCP